jgi:hypothetical protein
MALIVVEGNRKSGKTYFISSQNWIPVFKFDFNSLYKYFFLPAQGSKTHYIGLGKELMIHQLNKDGILPNILMDRGIITNSVWGVLNNRVPKDSVFKEIDYCLDNGLFKNTAFIQIKGVFSEDRNKDVWDYMDERIPEEAALFDEFFDYIESKGVRVFRIENKFDPESLSNFQTIIKNLK